MIEIKNLVKSFGEKMLFDHLSLCIENGEFVIFSGVSGCGKTTLLNIIGSIEPFDEGEILVDGVPIQEKKNQTEYLRCKVGFLFQNFALVDNKSVKKNMDFVKPRYRTDLSIEAALERVGMLDKINVPVYTLSGGEQQRVALARLMLKRCDIILADEPTGSLDVGNAEAVMRILESMNGDGKTVIIVTHDEKLKNYGRVINL